MKRYLWLAGVLLVFFLIYYFPARLAWSLLPPAAGEAVELYGISGPWHRGTATAARLAGVPVGELQWRLRPLPWHPLRAEISGELATGAPFGGRLSAGWGDRRRWPGGAARVGRRVAVVLFGGATSGL
ncbi:MAG: type II secretion system protein N [Desulfurivibrio sp.]|nr:type II secretion system protein N [Desulfurivibrio sp.]